ncbi:MAG: allantoinase AllB [Polyangiales bacterium]
MLRGLKSKQVVCPERVVEATVVLRDERIEDVVVGDTGLSPAQVDDLGAAVISPGLVDCHVHINEPGNTEWEGFDTATRAAAAGGVTTLVDMPLNSIPVTTSADALAQKLAASTGKRHVDVGFWGGVVPGNVDALAGLADAGVLGCKAFLVHSGLDAFPHTTRDDLARAMPVLRDLGLPLLAHAELDLGVDPHAPPAGPDPRSYRGYLASRPRAWEDAAIRMLIALCRETGCAVHIVHLSSASSIAPLREAKAAGLPITAETCPHYLCVSAEAIPDGATEFKCAPPIREHENRESLWAALFEGVIDFVISDHSPCTPALKLPVEGDFLAAWGGIASLQLGLPAIWSEGRRRGASFTQLARWLSAAPATFAGLGRRKGRIQKGYDADLVVWSPHEPFTVSAPALFFRHKVSPYLGRRLSGTVQRTVLRGRDVFDGRAHVAEPAGQALLHRA